MHIFSSASPNPRPQLTTHRPRSRSGQSCCNHNHINPRRDTEEPLLRLFTTDLYPRKCHPSQAWTRKSQRWAQKSMVILPRSSKWIQQAVVHNIRATYKEAQEPTRSEENLQEPNPTRSYKVEMCLLGCSSTLSVSSHRFRVAGPDEKSGAPCRSSGGQNTSVAYH